MLVLRGGFGCAVEARRDVLPIWVHHSIVVYVLLVILQDYEDDVLLAGTLQLSAGTYVVVDETVLCEGKVCLECICGLASIL